MKLISYLRVSTNRQGESGYGIDAQRSAIMAHGSVLAEYVEVESGKRDDRPELIKALAHCKKAGATLIIAKLDRLSRKVSFISNLLDSKVDFIICDNPHANKLTIQLLAVMAENERDMISKRTKEALAAAKSRGVKLGSARGVDMTLARAKSVEVNKEKSFRFAASVCSAVNDAMKVGGNLSAAAKILNDRGLRTSSGCEWNPKAVSRVIDRI